MTGWMEIQQSIVRLQRQVLCGDGEEGVFDDMLKLLLKVGDSPLGFVGEVIERPEGQMALQVRAISNIANSDHLQSVYRSVVAGEVMFEAGDTIIGELLADRCTLIVNDVASHPKSHGVPEGHPPIERFLGIPLMRGEDMIGAVGLANRQVDYCEQLIESLSPLRTTCSTLLEVYRERRQRKRQQQVLTESRRESDLMAAALQSARDGIVITDAIGTILTANDSFCAITGYDRAEIIGQNPRLLKSGRQDAEFYQRMWDEIGDKGVWIGELWNRRKSGEDFAVRLTISAIEADGPRQYVGVSTDITAIKQHEEQLAWLVLHDEKTGLPNRRCLARDLSALIKTIDTAVHQLCVAYLDIDAFRQINDLIGDEDGDVLLSEIGRQLKAVLGPSELLGRLAGDEFVVVMIHPADQSFGHRLEQIRRMVGKITHPGLTRPISMSVGATLYPQLEAQTADQLIRQADQAMCHAKLMGGDRVHLFDTSDAMSKRDRYQRLEEIRIALDEQQFVLYYQPQINLVSGETIGVEALIRWQHPAKGLLGPGAFLPFAENEPIMRSIGQWVLETAIRQGAAWAAEGLAVPVGVNISPNELLHLGFLETVEALRQKHGYLTPGSLQLEILESSTIEDIDRVSSIIGQCRELGIGTAIDDFGAGFASLTYLKRLDTDVVKIDQSFVRNIVDDREDQIIIQNVIGLAQALGRDVVAEGLETKAHIDLLTSLGCRSGQGYSMARPMPSADMTIWLLQRGS
jgi:diguanylate cyclase (GGDEF)-like protein/PAS domain S-box-containing protein